MGCHYRVLLQVFIVALFPPEETHWTIEKKE